jgi:cell division transport system ATP-binding protein
MQLLIDICRDYDTAVVMATHDYTIIQKYPARVLRIDGGAVREITPAAMH